MPATPVDFSFGSADGTQLLAQRTGSGPALLLFGGAFSTRHSGAGLAALLATDFTVFTLDRRGHGDSVESRPYAVEREIEDVRALIGEAGGAAMVYGHSSGAVLALLAAAAGAPITRLAVYEPPYAADERGEAANAEMDGEIGRLVAAGSHDEATASFLGRAGVPAQMIDGMRQSSAWPGMVAMAPSLPHEMALVRHARDARVPAARLAGVHCPVLSMAGTASPAWMQQAAHHVADAIRGARYHPFEGQTHAIDPTLLLRELRPFFS